MPRPLPPAAELKSEPASVDGVESGSEKSGVAGEHPENSPPNRKQKSGTKPDGAQQKNPGKADQNRLTNEERRAARQAALSERQGQAAASRPKQKETSANPVPKPLPTVHRASWKTRHTLMVLSFLLMVLGPIGASAWYLWTRAADQYISRVGFSVRTEDSSSAIDILGSFSNISGSSSTDTDILFQFLQSQELVEQIDSEIDLRSIWSRVSPEDDPIFSFHTPGSIEDLVDHWGRQVRIHYDSGLLDLEVRAFDPEDARAIAQMIFDKSDEMINELSAVAREDAISYARDELSQAEERLAAARIAIAQWRNENQTVDPVADTAGQTGLITNLQAQLAEALIEFDILRDTTTRDDDPRIAQADRRITVIRNRIEAERSVLGTSGDGHVAIADLVGQYERLNADLEFAQQAYTAALAAFDSARNDARRQSRYLAAHVRPTLAQSSEFPDRPMQLAIIGIFSFLIWAIFILVIYSLRDRR